MPLQAAVRNQMLDTLRVTTSPSLQATHASLHTADPSTSGANEVTGGSPAYARQSITWSAASAGSLAASNQPVFNVPATTVAFVGLWNNVSAGTWLGSADVTDEVFAAQGTYTLTAATIALS